MLCIINILKVIVNYIMMCMKLLVLVTLPRPCAAMLVDPYCHSHVELFVCFQNWHFRVMSYLHLLGIFHAVWAFSNNKLTKWCMLAGQSNTSWGYDSKAQRITGILIRCNMWLHKIVMTFNYRFINFHLRTVRLRRIFFTGYVYFCNLYTGAM